MSSATKSFYGTSLCSTFGVLALLMFRVQVGMANLLRDDREQGTLAIVLHPTEYGIAAVQDARETNGGKCPYVEAHVVTLLLTGSNCQALRYVGYCLSMTPFTSSRVTIPDPRVHHWPAESLKQGVKHWAVSNNWTLLFDPAASELPLLDLSDGPLLKKIYRDNGSGWIKIAVVRDPVTRLLSAYLDHIRFLSLRDADNLPSFAQVVEGLLNGTFSMSPAFRPLSNLCGIRYSPFDVVIPFERLQVG